jgi:hypothetical protein
MFRYLDFEELKTQLGYRSYKLKIGNVGQALIAHIKQKKLRSIGGINNPLELLYQTHKYKYKRKNGNKK